MPKKYFYPHYRNRAIAPNVYISGKSCYMIRISLGVGLDGKRIIKHFKLPVKDDKAAIALSETILPKLRAEREKRALEVFNHRHELD